MYITENYSHLRLYIVVQDHTSVSGFVASLASKCTISATSKSCRRNQRTIGPENAHLKPDLGVLSHNEMTLTLNTHTPLFTL